MSAQGGAKISGGSDIAGIDIDEYMLLGSEALRELQRLAERLGEASSLFPFGETPICTTPRGGFISSTHTPGSMCPRGWCCPGWSGRASSPRARGSSS